MIRLPEVNGNNWKKVLRELPVSKFPSLPDYLINIREKLVNKEELLVSEGLLGRAKLQKYFDEYGAEINSLYLQTIDWSKFSKRPPLEHQKAGVEFLLKNNRCILGDDMGLGKQLISNTLCITPKGKVEIGKLKIGDEIYGRNGKPCKVTGVFPQGINPLYNITFSDGKTIIAGLEHLWNVRSVNDKRRKKDPNFWRTVETRELLGDLQHKNRTYKWEIPRVQPIEYPVFEALIPPYILGVLIADGSISNGKCNICPGNLEVPEIIRTFLTNQDDFWIGSVDRGTSNYYNISGTTRRAYLDYINSVELNVIGDHKFIPDDYKYASAEQRKLLLQGLMDSDGTTLKGRARYTTVSRRLADDVVELVQSLGGMASVSVFLGGKKWREDLEREVEYQESYHVIVQTDFCPFLRPFHIARWKPSNKLVRNIVSIEYYGEADATCISVDAPDKLYVVEGHVVTHNTMTCVYAALSMEDKHKVLIVTLKSLKYNFKKEVDYLDSRVSVVDKKWQDNKFVIVHYDALKKWQKEIVEGDFSIMILDEAHKVRNPKAQRTKFIMEFLKTLKPLKIWLLTGTPIDNRPADYYNLLKMIKHPVAKNWVHYVERYCDGRRNTWGQWETDGASNLQELHNCTKDIFLRRLKTNAGIDMPEKFRKPIFFELANRKGYLKVLEDYRQGKYEKLVDEVGYTGSVDNVLVEEMTQLMIWRQFCALEKIQDGTLIEMVENVLEENDTNKVIVFTNFTKVVDAVYAHFGADACSKLDGRVLDPRKRLEIVDEFNANPKKKVFVLNQAVGSTGLNIQSANYVIVNDMNWVPSTMLQCEDRAWRIGQTRDVHVLYPIYDNTVESVLYDTVEGKMRIITTVVEGVEGSYFEDSIYETKQIDKKQEQLDLVQQILAQMGL